MVRVILGGGPAAGAGQAAEAARVITAQAAEERRREEEAERREIAFQRDLAIADLQVRQSQQNLAQGAALGEQDLLQATQRTDLGALQLEREGNQASILNQGRRLEVEQSRAQLDQSASRAAIDNQRSQLGLQRDDLNLRRGELDLQREQDPNSAINRQRELSIEEQEANIDHRNALAEKYRAEVANREAPIDPNAFGANDRLVQFLQRTEPDQVPVYLRLKGESKRIADERLQVAFDQDVAANALPRALRVEAKNPEVAEELRFEGAEFLYGEFLEGRMSVQDLTARFNELDVAAEDNRGTVAVGRTYLDAMTRMIGDPNSKAGVLGDEDGLELARIRGELEYVLDDPTPDEGEIQQLWRRWGRASADPDVRKDLVMAEEQALAYARENQQLREMIAAQQQSGATSRPDASGASVGEGLTRPVDLKPKKRKQVARALYAWAEREESEALSDEEFFLGMAEEAKKLGVGATGEELNAWIQELSSHEVKRGLPDSTTGNQSHESPNSPEFFGGEQ